MMGFLVYFLIQGEVSPNWAWWIVVPVELIHLGLFGMGVGIIISSMTTKYRDLSVLVGFGVSLWMYITPIVYPISQLESMAQFSSGFIKTALMLNPVTAPVEIIRYAILGQGAIMPLYLAISWALTIAVVLIGIMIFNKVEKTFMDTV
jgi:lipopolysaccharide transport system permease protein